MEDNPSLAIVYHRTGSAYYQLERYNEALHLYQKSLAIELKTLPDNAETIATTYSDLSTAYLGLEQFDEALLAGEQAINQLLKTLPYNHPEVLRHQFYLETIKQRRK
jgi:tetratricopeptide (TPR) repeat protein